MLDAQWRSSWSALADLGLVGLCVPEHRGGFGFRVDAAVGAAIELGGALHGAPYAGISASAYALAHADDPAAAEVLTGLLAGERVCAFGRLDVRSGITRTVDGAAEADALVVLDSDGALRLLTDPSTWSIRSSRPAFDVTRSCGDITVDLGTVRRLSLPVDPAALFRLLLAADALGGLQRSLDRAVAYSAQRQAFGRVIGGFQAVQHRLVDHTVRVRGLALVVTEAARLLQDGAPDADRHVTLAELSVSSRSVYILHDLVQLTGGIGFTWEHGLHLYERRAQHDAVLGANPRRAMAALARSEGWASER